MSLRHVPFRVESETTEAISLSFDIKEIAAPPAGARNDKKSITTQSPAGDKAVDHQGHMRQHKLWCLDIQQEVFITGLGHCRVLILHGLKNHDACGSEN